MHTNRSRSWLWLLLPLLTSAACSGTDQAAISSDDASAAGAAAADGRVSEFGRYEGYSEARFEEWVTESLYLEMRDGVKIALDVTRPAVDGVAVEEAFPVVWTHSRYHRNPSALAQMFAGDQDIPPIRSMVDAQPDLQRLVRHGYVVGAAVVRGSGASYGQFEGLWEDQETRDSFEIIEWLAGQPWSDGNVGMFGGSYLGITQYMAASQSPPALKAIFPNVAGLDLYDVLYPGGVYRDDMIEHWDQLTKQLDHDLPAPRVDADVEGVMMEEARAQHLDNWDTAAEFAAAPYRDHDTPSLTWQEHGPSGVLDQVIRARVPAYHFNGWYDIFVTDATLWYANYEGPQKMAIGGWSHANMPDSLLMADRARIGTVEQHRWFDYWLKGIDNGIMDEPPIHYAVMSDPGDWEWTSANAWPPGKASGTAFYFAGGPSGSVESVNDGVLVMESASSGDASAAQSADHFDEYAVDPTTTTGTTTRWDNAVGAAPVMVYPDMAPNDARSLTYTTPPLEQDVTVSGHPVATLYVTSTSEDADFYVLLEEVYADGTSRYVTEGVMRGSHRTLADAPWNNLGLPYQRSFEADRVPLPSDEPTQIVMDLHPTSTVFNAGNRIRVTIMGADADNAVPPPSPPPTIRIHRSAEYRSHIALPVAAGDS
jgi:putative CocE/NonD family hydrolase